MAISKKVLNYLDKAKVKYDVISHKVVYTAHDLAATLKEKTNNIAKTLLVRVDKRYILIVLPAHRQLDLMALKKYYKAKKAEIVKEGMIKKLFNIKAGTLTPFGALHKVDVLFDKTLAKADKAVVRAGSYTDSLRVKIKDLIELEDAAVASVGKLIKLRKAQKTQRKRK
ncbi:YbaK/EbsC family protein [Patescibacteria group bacterium]|nr:YbaK/EbsC family protein [Patescibacteria group bacterium]MBU1922056.1 YbaK/EbsC family protein [Patescibacteria group bacterium]